MINCHKYIKKIIQKNREFLGFFIVGIINTGLTFSLYIVLIEKFNLNYLISSILSYFFGIFIGFILNTVFVFKKNVEAKYGVKYFAVYISSLILNLSFLFILVDYFSVNKILAQVLVTAIIFMYNYILSKLWTYMK